MKFKSYVIFFLLFGVVSDVYICLAFPGLSPVWKMLCCLPTLAALVCLCFIGSGVHYTDAVRMFSYLTFLSELPKFVFMLFSLINLWAGIALGAGVALFFGILIFYSSRHLKVNKVELAFSGLPRQFDGFRICQLSDLHLGSFGEAEAYVKKIVDTALSLSPDVILFTGDLVNFESSEAEPYLRELARLTAPCGVYAIRGNHDYLLHGHHDEQARLQDTEMLLEMERLMDWNLLLNSNALISRDGASIALAGVENVSSNPYFTHTGGDLGKALEGIPEGVFTILLSHDPSHWRAEVVPSTDIPLTLSGHTHGLGYKLAGLNPSHWKLPESGGLYSKDGQVLHVSKGLGSAFAFRLGGFPMVDIITLKSNSY